MPLEQPLGLMGLLGGLPILAVYLLRRRSRTVEVPSVLLFRSLEDEPRYRSFLKRLVSEESLLLQLLAVLLLSLALSGPYTVAQGTGGLAVVVDGSASMRSYSGEAISASEEHIGGGRIHLLQAGPDPVELLRNGSADRARSLLSGLRPMDAAADISAAMRLAARRDVKRVVVVSDFLGWRGRDPTETAEELESAGVDVVFEGVGRPRPNTGFVGGELREGREGYTFDVHLARYGGAPGDVTYEVRLDGEVVDRGSVHLEPGGTEEVSVGGLDPGEVEVEVTGGPAFDDAAYAYVPVDGKSVYVVGERGYGTKALEAAGASVDSGGFPGRPKSYDVLLVKDYAGTEGRALRDYLESGGTAVFVASTEMKGEVTGVLPVEVSSPRGSALIEAEDTWLTEDVEFGGVSVNRYLKAEDVEGSEVHVATRNGTPVLASVEVGAGTSIYLGLPPLAEWNDFHFRRSYPVFWTNVLQHGSIGGNALTGQIVEVGDVSVETPSGHLKSGDLYLDEAGFYRWSGGTTAVNLFSPLESDTTNRLLDPSQFGPDEDLESTTSRTYYWPQLLSLLVGVLLYEAWTTRGG